MGRHVILRGHSGDAAVLAAGLYASTPVLTPLGWLHLADLAAGDQMLIHGLGPATIRLRRVEARPPQWSMLLPAGALGNDTAILLPPGQPVLIETRQAMPFCGEDQALVPAAALEGWRGIAAHVPARSEPILQLQLTRPGLLFAGPGLLAGIPGADDAGGDPSRPVLPLASARQLIARLMAAEPTSPQAALRLANRP